MAEVQETFSHKRMTASGALLGANGGKVGGFLCTTAGTMKLTVGTDGTGADIVSEVTLNAAQFLPIPLTYPGAVYATLGGGCIGTFFLA